MLKGVLIAVWLTALVSFVCLLLLLFVHVCLIVFLEGVTACMYSGLTYVYLYVIFICMCLGPFC